MLLEKPPLPLVVRHVKTSSPLRTHDASPNVEFEVGQQKDLSFSTPQHVPGVFLNAESQVPPPQHVSHPERLESEPDAFEAV